jgi:hypothetical protein
MTVQTIIFLHIPKAAGTTLHTILDRQYPPHTVFSNDRIVRARLGDTWREMPATQRWQIARDELCHLPATRKEKLQVVKGHMIFGWHELLPQPCTYITLLREPVDRVVSLYSYTMRQNGHHLRDEILARNLDIAAYTSSGITVWADNGQTRMLSGAGDSIGFGKCSDDMLRAAKRNIEESFALVGLSEQFDETLVVLKHMFDWRMPFYIRRNVTRHSPWQRELSAETRRAIEQHNALDIELYNWVSERFDALLQKQGSHFSRELSVFRLLNKIRGWVVGHPIRRIRKALIDSK